VSGVSRRLPAPQPLRRDQSLFLDFDGTLVEIAASPNAVLVPPELPRLLLALAEILDGALALVSGRPLDQLADMIAPFRGAIAGQHGLERRRVDGGVIRYPAEVELDRIRPVLAGFAARHRGVMLEDKGGTLALHYRQAPALAAACRALGHRAERDGGGALKMIDGKMVIELAPRLSGKGQAITAFLAEAPFHGRSPIFVGDDTTDEDGFAMVDLLGGVSVRVGEGATGASHRLASVSAVQQWLARSMAK
jgi:trehalose 6-phosphate phosphatase